MPDPRKLVTPLLEGLLKPMKRLDETFQPIKTYHASPHDFDTVDLSKVGTGQGATMYGHGFYSAQSPEVSGVGGAYYKEFAQHPKFESAGREHEVALTFLQQNKFDRQAAAEAARKRAESFDRSGYWGQAGTDRAAADMLESGAQVGPRVYETHLYARPEDYLDWDKPLGMQSKQVQSALENVGGWSVPYRTDWRGEDIYKSIADAAGGGGRGKKYATEALADVGVPGVRYLDQKSRGAWRLPDILREIDDNIAMLEGRLMDPAYSDKSVVQYREMIRQAEQRRALVEKQMKDATYNYVTGNTDIIDLAKKFAVPGALAPAALPYLNTDQMQSRY